MPRYPAELDAVGVGGSVRLRYTIDTAGRASPPYEILESAHDVLTTAVRSVLPRARFYPGLLEGRPVRVTHEEVFEFLADREELSPLPVVVLRRDSTPDGVPRTVIGRALRDWDAAASVPWAERYDAQRAALSVILKDAPRVDGSVVVCIKRFDRVRNPAAERALVEGLAMPGFRVVPFRDCPPTHTTMIARTDSLGRPIAPPAGWVDPHHLTTITPRPWNRDIIVVKADLSQGTAGYTHQCVARRTGAAWTAVCKLTRARIS